MCVCLCVCVCVSVCLRVCLCVCLCQCLFVVRFAGRTNTRTTRTTSTSWWPKKESQTANRSLLHPSSLTHTPFSAPFSHLFTALILHLTNKRNNGACFYALLPLPCYEAKTAFLSDFLMLLCLLLRAGCCTLAQSVTLHTDLGDIKIEMFCELVPRTAENFLALCASGYYDGTPIHRNIKGFIVQMGDPTGTGKGGESIWGGYFKDEFDITLKVRPYPCMLSATTRL